MKKFSQPTPWFWLFLVLHTLAWTLGPALARPSLPHDTLEGITWGLQWQLGYNKHPFLAAWLSAAVFKVFGSLDWPVYLLAQLSVGLSFYAVYRLAQKILQPWQALIATLALDGVLFYNINSFNFTPDSLQLPLWSLLSWLFYLSLTGKKRIYWLMSGFIAGLCVLAKYQAALLLFPLLIFTLYNSKARLQWKTPEPYLALVFFILTILPHLYWLTHHDYMTLIYALNTPSEYTGKHSWWGHLVYPLQFLGNNLGNCLGLFVLLWPFYQKQRKAPALSLFDHQFLLIIGLGPFVLSVILCLILGEHFPLRWSTPYFSLLGILLLGYLGQEITTRRIKQFAWTLIFLSLSLFIGRMLTFTLHPRGHSDAFLPNQEIAKTLQDLWQKHYNATLPYLAGSHYLVALVNPYISQKTRPYLSFSQKESPWIDEENLRRQGGLFIWDAGKNYTWDAASQHLTELPAGIRQRFPELEGTQILTFKRMNKNQEPVTIGVAILPPQPWEP